MEDLRSTPQTVKDKISAILARYSPGVCVDPRDVEALWADFNQYYQELNEAEGYLWELYENAPVPYATFDGSYRILTVNRAFRSLLDQGRPSKTFVTEYLDPGSLKSFEHHVGKLRAQGLPGKGSILVTSVPGGLRLKLESNVRKLGEDWEFWITLTDITGEYEAERALQASESRFKNVVEKATDGIMIMDDQAKILVWNSTIATVSGYPADQVVGTHIWDMQFRLAPPDKKVPGALEKLKAYNLDYIKALQSGAKPKVHENRICRPDGTLRTIQFTISFLQSGKETLFVTIFRDITESKALEAELVQAKKMEAIGLLVGGIAHDFNNFLGAIFGRLELAKLRKGLTPEVRNDLGRIETSAQHAAQMTKKLLMYARKSTTVTEIVDLNEVLKELLPVLQRLSGPEVAFQLRPCPGRIPVQLGRDQIDQIVTNLCINARDAILGVGVVTLTTSQESDFVTLEVADTGVGMDPGTMAKVFEPFFTTKKLGAGTGLGLATVHGIVYQNKGTIRVASEVGKGSQFSVVLPVYRGPLAPVVESPVVPPAVGGYRVLVVEDEPDILDFVVEALGVSGYRVEAAPSSEAALELLGTGELSPDLLVTDVRLPRRNGRELAGDLLARFPRMKVLYMSGFSGDILAKQGVITEDLEFLAKPFTLNDLLAKVAGCLT